MNEITLKISRFVILSDLFFVIIIVVDDDNDDNRPTLTALNLLFYFKQIFFSSQEPISAFIDGHLLHIHTHTHNTSALIRWLVSV